MKRLSILICTLLLVNTGVNAQKKGGKKSGAKSTPTRTIQRQAVQESAEQKFRFGIRAGANLAKITGEDRTRNFNEKFGYFGGFVARYSVTNKINVQSEVYYNLLGTKAQERSNLSEKSRISMSYISVPILGQYEITPQFYAETGPEISFNLSSKYKNLTTGRVSDWKDVTKTVNFAWAVGTGYYFTDNLGVNFRANFGLGTPFLEGNNGKVDRFRHLNFQLGMIYLF